MPSTSEPVAADPGAYRHGNGSTGRGLMFVLLAMIAGLWPLLAFGQPSYITDSSSYYRGGEAAWERLVQLLPRPSAENGGEAGAVAAPPNPPQEAVGVRSLAYSGVTFVLSAPGTSLLLLVLVQTMVASVLLWWLLSARGGTSWRAIVAIPVLLGLATSFPVFATLATPDLLAGLMILCLLLLATQWNALGRLERGFAGLVLVFAVASHASHILLAICALALAAAAMIWTRVFRLGGLGPMRLLAPSIALLGGLAMSLLSGLAAFGEVSAVPKRYPYALARAIEDGPARWYLEEKCPERRYAVCELFPGKLPGGVGDFLWAEGGIEQRATPEQMDRIRAEEPEILRNAFAAYPWFQVQASAKNVIRQFARVGIDPASFQGRRMDEHGYLQAYSDPPRGYGWHGLLQGVAVLLSLGVLAVRFRKADPPMRQAIVLTVMLIGLNNLICAILSAPDVRYQARTLWLLPILAALLAFGNGVRHSSETAARP